MKTNIKQVGPNCIWVFKEKRSLNNYVYFHFTQRKVLKYILLNNVDAVYVKKFAKNKDVLSTNTDAKFGCVWVLFDTSNGDETSKYYLWVFGSKKKN